MLRNVTESRKMLTHISDASLDGYFVSSFMLRSQGKWRTKAVLKAVAHVSLKLRVIAHDKLRPREDAAGFVGGGRSRTSTTGVGRHASFGNEITDRDGCCHDITSALSGYRP